MLQVLTFIGVAVLVSLELLKLALAFREARSQRRAYEMLEKAFDGDSGVEVKTSKTVIKKKANK